MRLSFVFVVGLIGCGSSQSTTGSPAGSGGSSGSAGAAVDGGADSSPGTGGASCSFGQELGTFGAGDGAAIAITADASGVYWTDTDGAIWRADPGGESPTKLATIPGAGSGLRYIAVHSDTVYVHDSGKMVFALPKSGGSLKFIGYTEVRSFAVDETGFYYIGPYGELYLGDALGTQYPVSVAKVDAFGALALDADFAYVKEATLADGVRRVPKAGGEVVDLFADDPHPGDTSHSDRELAVDATHVYWINPSTDGSGALERVAKAGGEPEVLATPLASPVALVLDSDAVYVTIRASAVAKFPLDGSPPLTLPIHEDGWQVAVDERFVYVTTKVVGAPLLRACK